MADSSGWKVGNIGHSALCICNRLKALPWYLGLGVELRVHVLSSAHWALEFNLFVIFIASRSNIRITRKFNSTKQIGHIPIYSGCLGNSQALYYDALLIPSNSQMITKRNTKVLQQLI